MPTVTLYSVADAYVMNGLPDTNFGSDVFMYAEDTTLTSVVFRSYLRFNLAAIPVKAFISAATLGVWADLETDNRTVYIWCAAGSWVESTITYNNQPGLASPYVTKALPGASGMASYTVDVLTLIRALMKNNTGFGFTVPNQYYPNRLSMYTREKGGYSPSLALTYRLMMDNPVPVG